MPYLLSLLMTTPLILLDFSATTTPDTWRIVNDGVMGGLSSSSFRIDSDGHGVFAGRVRLENNGGFAMVQFPHAPIAVDAYGRVSLRIKGDGKDYQFRLRADRSDRYTYNQSFATTGEWQTVTLDFADFAPAWRGRALDMPNFPGEQLTEMAILIGNKRAEEFELRVDWVGLK